jgi:aspartyl-tRNA(Asn)/glutamyl-tRNA(Gln) amidotransferase subunit C
MSFALMSHSESSSTVTEEQVRQVAALANLELTPHELPAMQRDLNAILGHIAQLNELDTESVEPMAQVSEVLQSGAERSSLAHSSLDHETPLRPDVPVPSLDRDAVLRSAPETDGVFFKLPRVMER